MVGPLVNGVLCEHKNPGGNAPNGGWAQKRELNCAPLGGSDDDDGTLKWIVICAGLFVVASLVGVGVYFVNRKPETTVSAQMGETDSGAAPEAVEVGIDSTEAAEVREPDQPEGAVYMKNGVWLDKDDNPIK